MPYQSELLLPLAPDILPRSRVTSLSDSLLSCRLFSKIDGVIEARASNGFSEYVEYTTESNPAGTSDGLRRCRSVGSNVRLGTNNDGEEVRTMWGRIVSSEFFLLAGVSDCKVAIFNIPSISKDCKDSRSR